jgi:hypothetical protein
MSTEQNQEGAEQPKQSEENGATTADEQALSAEQLTEIRQKAELADKLEKENASLKRDLKNVKKALEPDETPKKTEQQSNEPDYARLAFLNSQQVTHPDDQKLVLDEASRLKLPLTDVLGMEHVKNQLASKRDERVSQDGMPRGTGRKGGPNKGDVDYYLDHPDEVPEDLELHNKVIDARMNKHESENKFSKVPFIG